MMSFIEQLSLWNWLLVGIVFLALELLSHRGYCFWLAMLAGFVGFLQMLWPGYTGDKQLITFVIFGLIITGLWRARLAKGTHTRGPHMENFNIAGAYLGKTFVLQKNMKKCYGKVTLDNHVFVIRAKENLKKGADVKIIGHDGVILLIQANTEY